MTLRATILGCGSSGGVPRIGTGWGDCDPAEPKNRRRRCSLLLERIGEGGVTRAIIDTGPDLREQLLSADIAALDAVIYTHSHADHVHGIDDLRMVVMAMGARLPVWADGATADALVSRLGYVFVQPEGSAYPPILDLNIIDGPVRVEGAGGVLELQPFRAKHGRIDALGFRIGGLAYLPDVSHLYDETRAALMGLDTLIIDALRRMPHPTHAHLDQTLDWIAEFAPKQAVLTNMHNDLDYVTLRDETPAHVTPAYDGMVLEVPL